METVYFGCLTRMTFPCFPEPLRCSGNKCVLFTHSEDKKTCFSWSPKKMYSIWSCWIYLLGESALCMFTWATSALMGATRKIKSMLNALMVLYLPSQVWNSLDFFFSCTKTSFGINHVSSFNWNCIEQVTTPGDFQLGAGCCHPWPPSWVISMSIPQTMHINANNATLKNCLSQRPERVCDQIVGFNFFFKEPLPTAFSSWCYQKPLTLSESLMAVFSFTPYPHTLSGYV